MAVVCIGRRSVAAFLLFLPLAACATTGSTLGSGVGDTLVEHPPFYAGADVETLDPSPRLGFFPVVYQRGASQPSLFDPELGDDMKALLEEITLYLESAGLSSLPGGPEVDPDQDGRTPPDVRFGCPTETGDPQDDCIEREESALGRGSQPLQLSVGRPSADWTAWAASSMDEAAVDLALVVTLEVGQYWIRQRGWRGTKVVELGTRHEAELPWLTALEGPVTVLQLTGALVGRDGKALRIGAEGLLARRTGMTVSILGGQSLVTDEEVRQLRSQRRDDLPDRPLVWQAGVRTLVEQLTGRPFTVAHAQQG